MEAAGELPFEDGADENQPLDSFRVRLFFWVSSAAILLLLAILLREGWDGIPGSLGQVLLWGAVAAGADLLLVRLGRGVTLSMSLSVTLAAAALFSPTQAAIIAFLGSVDPMEFRGESSPSRMLFNRTQVAGATAAAAWVFGAMPGDVRDWPQIAVWSLLALSADALINTALVATATALRQGVPPADALRILFGADAGPSAALYVSLGLVAPLIALVYQSAGAWALVAFLVPLALARIALVRAEHLRDALERMRAKDEAIRRSTKQLSDGRRDERMVLSGELHDQVLPALFRVHLMAQVIKQDLDAGRLLDLDSDLPELELAANEALAIGRRTMGNFRRSVIGPGSLAETLALFAQQLESASSARIRLSLAEVTGTESALLVVYLIGQEAMTNAAKYSKAGEIRARLTEDDGMLRIVVTDDGIGFDEQRVDSQLHFGLLMMRERVEALGGRLVIDSRLGKGTMIAAAVPSNA